MLKKILITSGIVILTTLVSLWVYLLLFGVPESTRQTFTDLGVLSSDTEIEPSVVVETTSQLAPNTRLQQLTTREVAGFKYTATTNTVSTTSTSTITSRVLRYAEKGTGYVYEINLDNGEERQISNITIGQTVLAKFNPDGDKVVLKAEGTNRKEVALLELGDEIIRNNLEPAANNLDWSSNEILNYTLTNNNSTTAYSREAGVASIRWQIPLVNILVYWHPDGDLVINQPAPFLKSGVYMVKSDSFSVVKSPEYSLYGLSNKTGDLIMYSYFDTEEKSMKTEMFDLASSTNQVAVPAIPEKCAFTSTNNLWCGLSESTIFFNRHTLNDWYKGVENMDDGLWKVDRNNPAEVRSEIDLSNFTGRNIDVTDLVISDNDEYLFFRNKIDGTLWKYDL